MHEKLIHELEEERHLRLQSEKRLREVTLESERSRVQMRGLQQQFSRMEETVRNLLQNQGPPEGKKEETVNIIVYQEKLSEEERKHKETLEDPHMLLDEDSRSESSSTDEGKEKTKLLLERLKALEAENSALALENENQREQYERCLDEVANQVVQALLTQKDLREECVKLKTRVFDLEQQNRTLSVLFQQRVKPASDLLLQKLHSRILDLSSGDLLSEVERNQSLIQSRTDVDIHSSINWDKRISIASSLPSDLASPADELPPTRIKESHILEGLRKLQKRKVLLEPPSVITKWGYKDCMNSNEGIYSPGIKCGSQKEQPQCTPRESGSTCKEQAQAFTYDSDSHDDADDEASSLALQLEIPNKDHMPHCNKLTHSISDSLFGWESSGKNFSENTSSADFKEKPEKLTNFGNNCISEGELCPNMQLQQEKDLPDLGHMDMNPQLSDTDDYETLDELHIESSDEKSPSDLLIAPGTQTFDILIEHGKSQLASSSKEEKRASIPSNSRPKTFSFIKQQRVIKKTSSEECITVIFDAEDGEPIEFSSHQTGVVTVTRNEISINPAPTGPNAEYTELLPQGITNLQLGMNARDYTILKAPEDEREKRTHKDIIGTGTTGVLVMPTESLSPGRSIIENTHLQKETKSTHNTAYRSNSVSSVSMGMSHKQNLTKIPSRGKSLPQKSKVTDPDGTSIVSSPSSVVLEKSPALPPVKLSKFQKTQSPVHRLHLQPDSHIPKQTKLPPSSSKNPIKNDCIKGSKSSLLLPRPLITPSVYGEPPTKDKHCILGQEEIVKSPSPPPPPGRSASLLIRPNYEHSPPSSGKPGTNIPSEMAKTTLKSSPLKAFPSAVISSSQSMPEVQGKKSVLAFKKPDFSHPSSNEEKIVQGRCSSQLSSGTFAILDPSPLKVSPKRGSTKVFNHQVSGKNQGFSDTGLQTTKNIPLGCGPIEMSSSKSSSPGRRGQCSDCLPKSLKSHPISGNQSMSSQVNSPSSSPPSKSHDSTNNTQGSHDKGPKTRLPVGLKVLVKSPQLLRKSSTVPGKQEKESINAASKSCAAASKSKPEDSVDLTRLDATSGELNVSMADLDVKSSFASELTPENILLQSPMTCHIETDRGDVLENRFMKRSTSSSKPHLKPALGMNGAKARSQSFSIHSGEKSSTSASEVLGKVRTQIITNTTDRGNSLTRQNSATDGFTNKTVSGSITESLSTSSKPLEDSYSPQGSHGSTNSSGSQHGSPSKLPFRISTKTEEIHSTSRVESHKLPSQGNCPTIALPEEQGNGPYRCLPSPSSPSHLLEQASSLQSPRRIQCMGHLEANSAHKQEIHGMPPVTSEIGNVSQDASVPPTIEEKVMLCIQENVEKGQAQGPTIEAKQRTGPSIASWFGFRRSKLPALSGRKMDISKTKMEKKDAKSLGFGNKQQKVEKKKDKRKPELQCETENEFNRKPEMGDVPDSVLKNKRSVRIPQDIHVQMKFEQRNRLSPVTCSAKDTFMKELLNRVDKKTAQQTENGSNNVSSRSMSKGNSQGSTLPSNSISTQGNQKKNSKTKADMETPNETLIKEVTENLQEDEEDTIMESGGLSSFQSHIIESSCQMRTLDSGIGTFPLPDSGNRSTGRHACKPDTSVESEPFLSLQETLPSAPPIKAKTLEREVPSAANSQGSLESIIVHSTSDPVMTAKGIRPFQSRLPKPASSGINHLQRQNETELSPQASFEYSGKTMENETNLPDWNSDKTTKTQQQKLKQVEETKEDSENRLSKISLESLNKLNSNSVILLEKEKNCLNKVERQREEKGKNEDTSLKSSSRPGVDNLESLSDSLYDSFSSCASQGSNDV